MIDKFINYIALKFDKNKHSNWHTYSYVWWLLGSWKLRSDYIPYTAKRYAANVNKNSSYMPLDHREKTVKYHESALTAIREEGKL